MLLKRVSIIVGLLALAATPASATTFNFDGGPSSGTTATSLSFTKDGITTSLKGYKFADSITPGTLNGTNLSALTGNVTLSYSNRGVGVCSGENGSATGNSAGCPEIDSADEGGRNATNYNEGLLLSFTGVPAVDLLGAVLNIVDANDTLGIYGVRDTGVLDLLGFADGTITNPGGGFTVTFIGDNTNREYQLTFTPALGTYSRYFFTNMSEVSTNGQYGGDGYRLRSLTVAGVPEPATWAMMLLGFGFIGFQMRRSRVRKVLAV
ncbi:PEPxxWA-CTERM sorting domain-containing protein [Sphingomonas lutea]|uniref:PEPxxWA-CTERM sorting domain-containing protein n=1 Tax=Sphingomonas lutea TaxID=1045317 RepID=UPI001F21B508|nr:PEPxxWA-CTERM sorting domain-containing protein [Sphingomonas lutea]